MLNAVMQGVIMLLVVMVIVVAPIRLHHDIVEIMFFSNFLKVFFTNKRCLNLPFSDSQTRGAPPSPLQASLPFSPPAHLVKKYADSFPVVYSIKHFTAVIYGFS